MGNVDREGKTTWTVEEDQAILNHVKLMRRPCKWTSCAAQLPGRIGKNCRERWHNHLDPGIKKTAWTAEEDRILVDTQKEYGNQWAYMSRLLPGRTDNTIKNHWNSALRRLKQDGPDAYRLVKPSTAGQPSHHGTGSSVHLCRLLVSEGFVDNGQKGINGVSKTPPVLPVQPWMLTNDRPGGTHDSVACVTAPPPGVRPMIAPQGEDGSSSESDSDDEKLKVEDDDEDMAEDGPPPICALLLPTA